MNRAVLISEHRLDLYRLVWREDSQQSLKDYRITKLTFGVSASPFATIMAMKQNALDHQRMYPLATQDVIDSFYVDNGLDGADNIDKAIKLWAEMQDSSNLEDLCSGSRS